MVPSDNSQGAKTPAKAKKKAAGDGGKKNGGAKKKRAANEAVATGDVHHTQLLKGLLDMCLLAVIAEEPSYGYEMVRKLEERHLKLTSEGSIYPLLSRLKRKGLIESKLVDSNEGPARKYYHATPAGTATLTEWILDWRTVRDGVDDVLAGDHE